MQILRIHQKESTIGIFFALLWASAAIAMKIGINSSSPLTLAVIRFLIAGFLMVVVLHIFLNEKFPTKSEWLKVAIFGLLNITLYLGCLFAAIEYVSAGLMNLFISINPILIILFSVIFLNRKVSKNEIVGFIICFSGLLIASIPVLQDSKSSLIGLVLLIIGMSSYSIGSVYYKKIDLKLSNRLINGWQTLIGGILLLPAAYLFNKKTIHLDYNFYFSLFWLTIVISVFTTLLWLNLLKRDTVKASKWLFLAPVFGYLLSFLVLGEEITQYELFGTFFVIIGLNKSK
ncbi:DMT family transporter [Mariniflexile gromovii]|uniref:EamA family transporter n=1 Tax=Mariniflexile gromovii TaxID=362523 RepID=A0ABS4BUM0_9FLAO|nr:EamA family transporter [Mariniflexile gromovii]MBP0904078.1 EamA family transporter [Mariniflexile gromovii]